MRTRKTPLTHTHKERQRDGEKGRGTNKVFVSDACDRIEDCQREREREREGPTRFVCWMSATELKILRERERERAGIRERGRSRFMHQRLI